MRRKQAKPEKKEMTRREADKREARSVKLL
jgi:hypothetical protein